MFDSIVLVLLGFFGDGDGVTGHLNAVSINCIRSSFIRYCTDICNRSFSISSSHSCRYSTGIFCYEYSPFDSDFVFVFFSSSLLIVWPGFGPYLLGICMDKVHAMLCLMIRTSIRINLCDVLGFPQKKDIRDMLIAQWHHDD